MSISYLNHPQQEPLITIRQWQMEFCENNLTAAALLSFFDYWHGIKMQIQSRAQRFNEIARAHREGCLQDDTLLQFHTEEDLEKGVFVAKRDTIRKAIKFLESKGVISLHANPNPRYKFDNTRYFLFHPDGLNAWLDERSGAKAVTLPPVTEKSSTSSDVFLQTQTKLQSRRQKLQSPSPKNPATITEITPEITNGDLKHTLPTLSTEPEQPSECAKSQVVEIEILDSAEVGISEQNKSETASQPEDFVQRQPSAAAAERYKKNQPESQKRIDGSDVLPWDTCIRGEFDPGFEQHMAKSLMHFPTYQNLMAGELQTKVRKHISAGRYDLKRRDELFIEWQAYQAGATLEPATRMTAKQASRRAHIAKALGLTS